MFWPNLITNHRLIHVYKQWQLNMLTWRSLMPLDSARCVQELSTSPFNSCSHVPYSTLVLVRKSSHKKQKNLLRKQLCMFPNFRYLEDTLYPQCTGVSWVCSALSSRFCAGYFVSWTVYSLVYCLQGYLLVERIYLILIKSTFYSRFVNFT